MINTALQDITTRYNTQTVNVRSETDHQPA